MVPALLTAAVMAGGCAIDSGGDSGGDSGVGCDQACVDEFTAYGILKTVEYVHNAIIAGNPEGAQNESGTCPLGGAVTITGTIDVDTSVNIQTNNLDYQMSACGHAQSGYFSLALSGLISQDGTFTYSTGTYISMTFAGTAVTFTGTILDDVPVSGTCGVSIGATSSGVSGAICGRFFSY